ncbi:MAG: hypothetical protein LLG00_00405 [Planctomycetaceae bacterium]|nr:hypothetical protein [Planctomycetaceae bacterium]
MQATSDVIFEAALKLPEAERLTLASRLLATIPEETVSPSVDDPALVDELDRRFAAREGSIAWSELRAEN